MSILTAVIGGIQTASAAGNAAKASVGGYLSAADQMNGAVRDSNAKIDSTAGTAGRDVREAAGIGGERVVDQARWGATNLSNVAATGGTNAVNSANAWGQTAIGTAERSGVAAIEAGRAAAAGLDPYAATGAAANSTLGAALADGGRLNRNVSAAEIMKDDPGYQFRVQQGQQALERSQSASGATGGGGASKALARYGQGVASSEYGAAFDRYTQTGQNLYNNLAGTAARGLSAAEYQGNTNTAATQYAGNLVQGANQYAGTLGQNAYQYQGNLAGTAAATNAAAQNAAEQFRGNANTDSAIYQGNTNVGAANLQGNNTLQGAVYAGNAGIGAGNAKAAGIMGRAAAWNGMLSGIDNAFAGAAGMMGGG